MDKPVSIVFRDLYPQLGWGAQFEEALHASPHFRSQLSFIHGFPKDSESVRPADIRAVTVCLDEFNSGIRALETLRKIDSNTPFLIVTDVREREAIVQLFSAGPSDFVSQPLQQSEVFSR